MTEETTRVMPYSGTSHARLAKLIRQAQPLPMPVTASFTFGQPEYEPVHGEGGCSVEMSFGIAPHYQSDPVQVIYYRLSLEVLKNLPHGELLAFTDIEYPTTTHQILDRINDALGLDLVPEEVVDLELAERPSRMPVFITEQSLAWIPGEYYFDMIPIPYEARITMDQVVRITQTGRIRVISVKPKEEIKEMQE